MRLFTLSFCFFAASASAQSLSVTIPSSAPPAAITLSPSLFSFSIEQDGWTLWAGTNTTNTFLVNVLDNIIERAGDGPWFRIGADSEDRTDFNPAVQYSQTVSSRPSVATPYPEVFIFHLFPLNFTERNPPQASEVIVGDQFYQIADHLPSGTHVVWGVNLRHLNATAFFLEASAIHKAFTSEAMKKAGLTLEFIEIGNEPDRYPTPGWNYTQYVSKLSRFPDQFPVHLTLASWSAFATNLSESNFVGKNGPKLFGPSFASVFDDDTGFSPKGVISAGILNGAGSLLTTYSQHHYSCGAGENLVDLLVKDNIRSNVSILAPGIAVAKAHGLDYVLGETNSCFGHGAVNTSNVGGIAVWTTDYLFNAAQAGVSRLFFHQGIGYKYNAIQPATLTRSTIDGTALSTPLLPHVQPAYHAALVAAEAIGPSGHCAGIELSIDDADVSGYAFYEQGVLKRALLMSHTVYLSSSSLPRGSKQVDISFANSMTSPGASVRVKRLSIPSADATTGLRWAGQSFDTPDGKATGAGGGLIASIATCPLDVIKTRLQAQRAIRGHHEYEGILEIVRSIVKHDGLRGFYRGLGPTMLGYLPTWGIYFSVYDGIKTAFGEPPLGVSQEKLYPAAQVKGYQPVMREHPWSLHILSAMTAGAASTICTNPLWVIKTRFMTQSRTETRYKHTIDAAMTIYRTEGISAFYRGLLPSLMGITHVAVQFPLYEQLKVWAQAGSPAPPSNQSILLCSAIAKMTASIATYPHEVVRTRLQTQRRPLAESSDGLLNRMDQGGVVHTTRKLIKTEGWKSLYKGLSVNLIRTVPNSAVTMLTYEVLMRHLYRTP
ncbi:unnamed protein product [Mycena citricolor]|uniref:Beta-glucuronidase C-terminal domain-containing protein n=1 Tax=Mycena citricolor TaxID=2018698 RepID=A0AAD2K837_9AGAR|nr:unnamed protein product [Mycena citricolor]